MSEEAQAQPAIADLSGEGNVEGVQKQEAAPQEPIPPLDPAQVAWQQQMQQYTEYWKSHQPSQGQAAPFYTGGGVSHPFGLWPAQVWLLFPVKMPAPVWASVSLSFIVASRELS